MFSTGILGYRSASTPMEPNHKLGLEKDSEPVDQEWYRRLLVSWQTDYISHTRPDIAFAISLIS